jgi:hypothetical protein
VASSVMTSRLSSFPPASCCCSSILKQDTAAFTSVYFQLTFYKHPVTIFHAKQSLQFNKALLNKIRQMQSKLQSTQFPHAYFAPWHSKFMFNCIYIFKILQIHYCGYFDFCHYHDSCCYCMLPVVSLLIAGYHGYHISVIALVSFPPNKFVHSSQCCYRL